MKLDKKTFQMILLLMVLVVLFAWFVSNLNYAYQFLLKVISILRPFFLGLIFAFLINIVMRPLEALWLRHKPKKPGKLYEKLRRPLCLVFSLLIVFGVIFSIIFIVVPKFSSTLMSFVNKLPDYLINMEQWWNGLTQQLEKFAVELPPMELQPEKIVSAVSELLASSGSMFLSSTIGFTSSLVSTVFDIFVSLVFCIYILSQKEHFGASTKRVAAAIFSPERVNSIYSFFSLVNKSFTSYVTGQLTEAVIIGLLCFTGMLIFQMPYAAVISVLVGFTALIPMFGAFIGTAVGAFLILLDSPVKAFWFVVFIIVLQQFEGNIIYPRVVGKSVGLPAIFVLMAVTVGGSAFGVLGMLVSVPIVSVIYVLVNQAVDKRLKEKGIENIS